MSVGLSLRGFFKVAWRLPFASPLIGVGSSFRPRAMPCTVGAPWNPNRSADELSLPSVAVGVGSSLMSVPSCGRTAAPSDGDWFVPPSSAIGVGRSRTTVGSPGPFRSSCDGADRFRASFTVRVGSKLMTSAARYFPCVPASCDGVRRVVRCSFSDARGVGSNGEDPVTEVRGTEGSSGNAIPDRVVPERGQVPDHRSPHVPSVDSKEIRDVLQQDEAGS